MKTYNILYCVLMAIAIFNLALTNRTFDNTYIAVCCMVAIVAFEAKRKGFFN